MKPTQEQLEALWNVCKGYVEQEQISCGESIYQCDGVILNAYEFLEKMCDIVGYWEPTEDDL